MSSPVTDSLLHAVHTFGPAALFFGAGLEGQTAVVAGGILAHKGVISLAVVLVCAAAGSAVVDQLLFWLGRYGRKTRFVSRAVAKPAFGRAMTFIERHPVFFILAFRYMYGLRAIGPVGLGISGIGARLFMILNLLAAVVWAALFTGIGYFFGQSLQALLEHVRLAEYGLIAAVVAAVIAVGVALALIERRNNVRSGRGAPAKPAATSEPP